MFTIILVIIVLFILAPITVWLIIGQTVIKKIMDQKAEEANNRMAGYYWVMHYGEEYTDLESYSELKFWMEITWPLVLRRTKGEKE